MDESRVAMGFLTQCPICGGLFDDGRTYTSVGVVFPREHFLYPFCDAGLHLECLENWPHRAELAKVSYDAVRLDHLTMHTLLDEAPGWFLGCGPAKLNDDPYYAAVWISDWPLRLYTRFRQWPEFVQTGFSTGLTGTALHEATLAVESVRKRVPNLEALRQLRLERLSEARINKH